jgi:hypothetical protein
MMLRLPSFVFFAALALLPSAVHATPSLVPPGAVVVDKYSWPSLSQAGKLPPGATIESQPQYPDSLRIENPGPEPMIVQLLTIENPKISTDYYVATGMVRYQGVASDGFLEMWNHFGPGAAYFSRTLATSGPMGKLKGSSDWRPFILPFNATGATGHPTRLEVNLHLPAKGTVWIGNDLILCESTPPGGAATPWWTLQQVGTFAGIIGPFMAVLLILAVALVLKGKGRTIAFGVQWGVLGVGIVGLGTGVMALTQAQPLFVWLPPMGLGMLTTTLMPLTLLISRRSYSAWELRKMASLDAVLSTPNHRYSK